VASHSVQEELLDVVDVDDNLVRRASRGEIHRRGWLHRAVHLFVFNGRGEVYVQRRSSSKDRFPQFLDSSAAGHVDPGESYENAALRELQEELGIEAELHEVLRVPASDITDNEHVVLYRVETDAEPVPDPEEIQWGGFMTPAQLTSRMKETPGDFVPGFIYLWEEYLRVTKDEQVANPDEDLL